MKWIINGEDSTDAEQSFVVTGDATIVAVYEANVVGGGDSSSASDSDVDTNSSSDSDVDTNSTPDSSASSDLLSGCFGSIGVLPMAGLGVAIVALLAKKRKED